MNISKIDPTLSIEKLKSMAESQFFDRKSARITPKDFSHQLSAFANASGGMVVIGIEDDGIGEAYAYEGAALRDSDRREGLICLVRVRVRAGGVCRGIARAALLP